MIFKGSYSGWPVDAIVADLRQARLNLWFNLPPGSQGGLGLIGGKGEKKKEKRHLTLTASYAI